MNHHTKRSRKWRRANPERARFLRRRFYRTNRDSYLTQSIAYREANPEYYAAKNREFREKNPDYQRKWRAMNKLRTAWLSWTRVLATNRETI